MVKEERPVTLCMSHSNVNRLFKPTQCLYRKGFKSQTSSPASLSVFDLNKKFNNLEKSRSRGLSCHLFKVGLQLQEKSLLAKSKYLVITKYHY